MFQDSRFRKIRSKIGISRNKRKIFEIKESPTSNFPNDFNQEELEEKHQQDLQEESNPEHQIKSVQDKEVLDSNNQGNENHDEAQQRQDHLDSGFQKIFNQEDIEGRV